MTNGSTVTGPCDAFASFGYLGVIKFAAIAWILGALPDGGARQRDRRGVLYCSYCQRPRSHHPRNDLVSGAHRLFMCLLPPRPRCFTPGAALWAENAPAGMPGEFALTNGASAIAVAHPAAPGRAGRFLGRRRFTRRPLHAANHPQVGLGWKAVSGDLIRGIYCCAAWRQDALRGAANFVSGVTIAAFIHGIAIFRRLDLRRRRRVWLREAGCGKSSDTTPNFRRAWFIATTGPAS